MLNNTAGLSLLELMIALLLGLVVMSAAMTMLISAQRMLHVQYALDEVQQHANWGLAILTQELRQANFNMPSRGMINNKINGSGIVFSQVNLPKSIQQNIAALVTLQEHNEAGTEEKSDQLLIQYRPIYRSDLKNQIKQNPTTNYIAGVDCEGRQIEGNRTEFGEERVIVNRYFVALDPQQISGEPTGYSLFCESGWYRPGDAVIGDLNGGGQQLLKRVDAFKIRLGVQAANGQLSYMTINQYNALMTASMVDPQQFYQVVSVELGLLLRVSIPSTKLTQRSIPESYSLLDQTLHLKSTPQNSRYYLRHVVSQVVALRNVQGL